MYQVASATIGMTNPPSMPKLPATEEQMLAMILNFLRVLSIW